jgi:hypothetical protein
MGGGGGGGYSDTTGRQIYVGNVTAIQNDVLTQ